MTEEEFNEAIDKAQEAYAPIIEEIHGARLKINKNWSDSTVNASASQWFGTWNVEMYGGLARRPEVSLDGFTLVICHEIGHHLAGYPFASRWAANEGQSDYFGTLSCARRLWGDEAEINQSFREQIPERPRQLCDSAWSEVSDQDLCYRMMAAGKSLAELLGAMRGDEVSFDAIDSSVVAETDHSHPAAQCRLDTYMAGALCNEEFDPTVIPAKDLAGQRNSIEGEQAAAAYSCKRVSEESIGVRPLCWFKPLDLL
jgi:hypothetical protein